MPGRIIENINRNLVLPGGSIDVTGAYITPLMAPGGGLIVAANTANQTFSNAVSGSFGFMTDLFIINTATAAVAATIGIQDASGGTVLWGLSFPATGPILGTVINIQFSNPLRTSVAGGIFVLTTTGAGVTWMATCNGYTTSSLGLG